MAAPIKPKMSSPELQALLERLLIAKPGGSTSGGGARGVSLSSNDMALGQATQGGKTYYTDSGPKPISPDIMDVASKVVGSRANLESLGGKTENTTKRPGMLSRILDVLSRGNYAAAESIRRTSALDTNNKKNNAGDRFSAFGHGAWAGLSGNKKTTFNDVIKQEHPKFAKDHKVLSAIAGVALDIAADPLTYAGVGLVSGVGKAGAAAKSIQYVTRPLVKAGQITKEEAKIVELSRVTSRLESGASAAGRERDIAEVAQKVSDAHGLTVKNEALAAGATAKDATDAAVKASADTFVRLRQLRETVAAESKTSKALALRVGNLGGPKVQIAPVGLTNLMAAPYRAALKHIDPVAKADAFFQTKFNSSLNIFPELHAQQLRSHSDASGIVTSLGHHWRQTFSKTDAADREVILKSALGTSGPHKAGVMVPDINNGGVMRDGGELLGERLSATSNAIQDGEFDFTRLQSLAAREGLVFKKGKVKTWDGTKFVNRPDPNWVLSSLRSSEIKDAGQAAFLLDSLFAKANAEKSMWEGLATAYGVGTRTLKDLRGQKIIGAKTTAREAKAILPPHQMPFRDTEYLKQKGWRAPIVAIPELQHTLFDPEVARGIEKIAGMFGDPAYIGKTMQQINNLTGKWKYFVTVPNPGFHIRNSFGDAIINEVDGVSPYAYSKALKAMRKRETKYGMAVGNTETGVQGSILMEGASTSMRRAASHVPTLAGTKYQPNFVKNRHGLIDAAGNKRDYISEAEFWAGYEKYGMRQNYASGDYGKAFSDPGSMGSSALRKTNNALLTASNNREDYFRFAHFIHLIQTNPSKAKTLDQAMEFAATRVRQTHFDYSDFTDFEKRTMATVIPFYKWTRKSLPLQAQFMFTNPGKIMAVPKMQRAIQQATDGNWQGYGYLNTDEVTPKWLRTGGFVSAGTNFGALGLMDKLGMKGEKGATSYMNVSTPFTDAVTQWGNVATGVGPVSQQVGSMLNPAIKMPMELFSNKQFFSGAPITSNKGTTDNLKRIAAYAASQAPMANVPTQAVKGNRGTMASWLTGLSTQENTTARQKNELIRQQQVLSNALIKRNKKLGITP